MVATWPNLGAVIGPQRARQLDEGDKLCIRLQVRQLVYDHGIQVSHSKVYNIQVKRDDHEAGRINTRAIRPLPKQAQFKPVGKRGERY